MTILVARWLLQQLRIGWPRPAAALPAYLIGVAATYWLLDRVWAMVVPAG